MYKAWSVSVGKSTVTKFLPQNNFGPYVGNCYDATGGNKANTADPSVVVVDNDGRCS